MSHHLFSLIITLILVFGATLLFQYMGNVGFLFASPQANCYGIIVMRGGSKEEKESGGDVIGLAHAIPGKKEKRHGPDLMKLELVNGVEQRDWLFKTMGIIWLGPYKTIRKNKVRSFRYGREDTEDKYRVMPKSEDKRWIPHSGQQDIEMKDIETKDVLGVNLKINLPVSNKFPIRSRLKVADPNAFLTLMVQEEVVDVVGNMELKKVVSGQDTSKRQIALRVTTIANRIEEETGLTIGTPNIFDVSMNEKTKTLMELEAKTKREMEAKILAARQGIEVAELEATQDVKRAEGRKRARILDNDAEADHIDRNVKPRAADDRTVKVTEAEAYRDNQHVTTSVRVGL